MPSPAETYSWQGSTNSPEDRVKEVNFLRKQMTKLDAASKVIGLFKVGVHQLMFSLFICALMYT